MHERTPIEELELAGSPNLLRAKKREAAEASATLEPETRTEVERLDELIAQAMRACKRGHTFRGKSNPAFEHLTKLIKCRDLLTKGKRPKKSAQEILNAANAALGIN
jgi:hypothetical protein